MDANVMFWGMLYGSLGLGYLSYGKRQKRVVPFVCGLALIVFPYFISTLWLLLGIGLLLSVIPYFVRL
jgi:hypothetical protein